MTDQFSLDVDSLVESIEKSRKHHARIRAFDAWLFNGGTVLVLALTSTTAFLEPGASGTPLWLPRALAAVAAVVVGLERSLAFGQRWRFHIEQETGYQTVLDMISFLKLVPEQEKPAQLKSIWDAMKLLRGKESAIPGVASESSQGNAG